MVLIFFFFSSRRRHTRCSRDWSSDVCSSDLVAAPARLQGLLDLVLDGRPSEALDVLATIYEGGGELRQVVRGLMERCRDLLIAAIERRDEAARARLSGVLDALLHLDGEVRRHAEPRFL